MIWLSVVIRPASPRPSTFAPVRPPFLGKDSSQGKSQETRLKLMANMLFMLKVFHQTGCSGFWRYWGRRSQWSIVMEVKDFLSMNEGDGEHSFARNSHFNVRFFLTHFLFFFLFFKKIEATVRSFQGQDTRITTWKIRLQLYLNWSLISICFPWTLIVVMTCHRENCWK